MYTNMAYYYTPYLVLNKRNRIGYISIDQILADRLTKLRFAL
jgi:hypothetical protein